MSLIVFDGLLILALITLAWQAMSANDPVKAIAMFVGFGVMMAVAWARLAAPDVAIAEAAIGAGLTGALFMFAIRGAGVTTKAEHARPRPVVAMVALSALMPTVGVAWILLGMPAVSPGRRDDVLARLAASGVDNPVTAVLLNFRGYDTLLELLVLLLALLGVGIVSLRQDAGVGPVRIPPGPVLRSFVRLIAPLMVVVAGYLLWVGGFAPGGAFQAGAVLAAAVVVLLLRETRWLHRLPAMSERLVLTVGPVVFLSAAVIATLGGRRLLEYLPRSAATWILIIEATSTVSIGLILACLFAGGRLSRAETRRGDAGKEAKE